MTLAYSDPAVEMLTAAPTLSCSCNCLQTPPDWQEILTYFRGSELQNYFTRILEDNLKAIIKPQYVDHIPRAVKGNVGEVLQQKDERDMRESLAEDLELTKVRRHGIGSWDEAGLSNPNLRSVYHTCDIVHLTSLRVP